MRELSYSDVLKSLGYPSFITTKVASSWNFTKEEFSNGVEYRSYCTPIAFFNNAGELIAVTNYHDYSSTTCKHCTQATGMSVAERRKKIASGELAIVNIP